MRVTSAGVVLLAVVGLFACGNETADETADESAGSEAGAAVAAGASTTAEPSADESAAEPGSSDDGPPEASPSSACPSGDAGPDIPAESTPPTTLPGMEGTDVPNGLGSDEMLPLFGQLVVDVEPQGCVDIPTQFRANQRVQVFTHADDGKRTHVEVFAPDGQSIGQWDTGEPETLEGWDFYNDTPMPADGTYVFRVTHEGGSDEPFMIAFYGDA